MDPVIETQGLSKSFKVPVRQSGLGAAIKSLFDRTYTFVDAVQEVSFTIERGEIVGFLGPNGAGKTTTLKMLSGLLHPSRGRATVNGYVPWKRDNAYLRTINMVMGNRHQLNWDLPAGDSYKLFQAIYEIPDPDFNQTVEELTELLELGGLLEKPVRNLSLGERMKCEFAGALLHRPSVMFLDEPTLGLDVTMQHRIRRFIRNYNSRYQSTILLTSHYMEDIAALCERVVVIHRGRLLFDGPLAQLVDRFAPVKRLSIKLDTAEANLESVGTVVGQDGFTYYLEIAKDNTTEVTSHLLANYNISDIAVEDPPIEQVIEQVFAVE